MTIFWLRVKPPIPKYMKFTILVQGFINLVYHKMQLVFISLYSIPVKVKKRRFVNSLYTYNIRRC